MGISGIGPGSLLLILLIVILLFGTKKLKSIGNDLGGAVKGFRDSLRDEEGGKADEQKGKTLDDDTASRVIDSESANHDKPKAKAKS